MVSNDHVNPLCYLLQSRKNMLTYAVKTINSIPNAVKVYYNQHGKTDQLSAMQILETLNSLEKWIPSNEPSELESFLVENITEFFDVDIQQHLIDRLDKIFVLSSINQDRYPKKADTWIHTCLNLDKYNMENGFYNNKVDILDFIVSLNYVMNNELSPNEWIDYLLLFTDRRQKNIQMHDHSDKLYSEEILSKEASQLLLSIRNHLGLYDWVTDCEISLIVLFPHATNILQKGCRYPKKYDTLDVSCSVHVLDEIVRVLLPIKDVETPKELESINLNPYKSKIISSLDCEKLNYFRICAILLKSTWAIRWTDLGLFGSSLLKNQLETERINMLNRIKDGNDIVHAYFFKNNC